MPLLSVFKDAYNGTGTHIALSMIMLSLLCTIFFIPAMPGAGYEVRGNGEMFPLNGPCWSLFFEYLGNILYALFIHRLSNKALCRTDNIAGSGIGIIRHFRHLRIRKYGVGWTLDGINFGGGLLRMLFLSPWACFCRATSSLSR